MRALLVTQGSTGDVFPVIALGRAIHEAGGQAVIATSGLFREDVERAGLGFLDLPPDWSQAEFAEVMKGLNRASNPLSQLCLIYNTFRPYFRSHIERIEQAAAETDILVASYLLPFLGEVAARVGIPFAVTSFCHSPIPSPDYPPDNLPHLSWLPRTLSTAWNRLGWFAADTVISAGLNRVIGSDLKACSLSPIRRFCSEPAPLALVTVSPALMKPDARIDPRFCFSGYLRHQPPEDPVLAARLDAFCAEGKVPVLTFGSVVSDNSPAQFRTFLSNWPRGQQLIVQAGWAEFTVPEDRPEILGLGKTNHDLLFRYASVVMHHGGAGTTGTVLHAGVPHLVVPHIADQFFWAKEVRRLGVGLSISSKHWPRQAPQAIKGIVQNKAYREKAEKVAATLAQENGGAEAVSQLKHLIQWEKTRSGGTPNRRT